MTQPYFSVIIPTHARPDRLAACLEALANLDYPRDRFEVIVVDDGTTYRRMTLCGVFPGVLTWRC